MVNKYVVAASVTLLAAGFTGMHWANRHAGCQRSHVDDFPKYTYVGAMRFEPLAYREIRERATVEQFSLDDLACEHVGRVLDHRGDKNGIVGLSELRTNTSSLRELMDQKE